MDADGFMALLEDRPPEGWDSGFGGHLQLIAGEVPFPLNGAWYLHVRDPRKPGGDDILTYSYATDRAVPYDEFRRSVLGVA